MESRILFLGPVGSGKTTAIRSVSNIQVVDTDARASNTAIEKKEKTTVAMDLGVIELEGGDRIVLYGAPGQERFDFMWEILIAQCEGIFLLIDHSAINPIKDLNYYLAALKKIAKSHLPLLIGITHADNVPINTLVEYEVHVNNLVDRCSCIACTPPVQRVDARNKADINAALITLAALIEVEIRFPNRICSDLQ